MMSNIETTLTERAKEGIYKSNYSMMYTYTLQWWTYVVVFVIQFPKLTHKGRAKDQGKWTLDNSVQQW